MGEGAGRLSGTVLDARGTVLGGGVELDATGRLTAILPTPDGETPGERGWLTPGLIDAHCHGGGGVSFSDTTGSSRIVRAIGAHRRRGTTALIASLVSLADPLPALHALVESCEDGDLAGIHLEGPYLSPAHAGAQNPAAIRPLALDDDLGELRRWLAAGRGHVRTMTLAPELPGAQGAARLLLEHGARPSWGHTSATAEEARAVLRSTADAARALGIDGPAQSVTHLFNAMPQLTHRDPGPVREFLTAARRGEAVVEIVADGVHVAPDLVGDVVRWLEVPTDDAAAPDAANLAFVSDAISGAGMPDGTAELGGLPVTLEGGAARLAGTGTIAGGTSRLAQQVTALVGAGLVSMPRAVRATVAGPAAAVGLNGSMAGVTLDLVIGERPNLVAWTPDLAVRRILREGRQVAVGT